MAEMVVVPCGPISADREGQQARQEKEEDSMGSSDDDIEQQ